MSGMVSFHQRPDVLNKWLATHGFIANPFAIREAGQESRLSEYFVEGPYYRDILGAADDPCTCFVFATRGCGKSAYRVMIQNSCRPTDRDSSILAVPYLDFRHVLAEVRNDLSKLTLDHHLRAILSAGLTTLFHEFVEFPESFLQLPRKRRNILKGLIKAHAPRLLDPTFLSDHLREWDKEMEADRLEEAADRGRLGEVLSLASEPVLHFLNILFFFSSPEPPSEKMPLIEHWRTFVTLVQRTGLQAVYVLVDGLDEFFEAAVDPPGTITTLLLPLILELPLMEMPSVAFKFFLPAEVIDALREKTPLRFDRLRRYHLQWKEDDLLQMLRYRLEAFSDGRVSSLDALSDVDVIGRIDRELARWAYGSPRTLLTLGDILFAVHCDNVSGGKLLLTEDDLQQALNYFQREYGPLVPPLTIDEKRRRVLIGGRVIREKLSPLEYTLLLFLYQNAGEIKSKDDIWVAVYKYTPEGVSDEAIESLVFRLRQKIEPNPKKPVYLVTERRRGYRLMNTA